MTIYSETISDLLIFKTNIFSSDVEKLAPILDQDTRIKKWNIDCEDIDHVLRVETDCLAAAEVIKVIHGSGFFCEELPD
jgi:hypothetical protein